MTSQDLKQLLMRQGVKSATSLDAYVSELDIRAAKRKMHRAYRDGDHPCNLTAEMRNLILAPHSELDSHPFSLNYCPVIVNTEINRLNMTGITADNEAGETWANDLQRANHIDALQIPVHDSAVTDGDTFLLAYYDADLKQVRWSHEPAYDGDYGMDVIYRSRVDTRPWLAFKIWHESSGTDGAFADITRANVYTADALSRYIKYGSGSWELYEPGDQAGVEEWLPGVVPVVHFRNKAARYDNYGRSELEDVVPQQDLLNAVMLSSASTNLLTSFPIRYAVGWSPPASLTPGMWIKISPSSPLTPEEKIDIGTMEQGEVRPFVEQAEFIIRQMATITSTPIPELVNAGSSASGESIKARESGLLGKIRQDHIVFGASWEELLVISHAIEMAFSPKKPPAYTSFSAQWETGEIRNDAEVIDNAIKIADYIDSRTFLEIIAPIYDWDAAKIDAILAAKQAERSMTGEQPGQGGADDAAQLADVWARVGLPSPQTAAVPALTEGQAAA